MSDSADEARTEEGGRVSRLTGTELRMVDEALEELRVSRPSTETAGLGCLVALPGFLIVFVVPVVGRLVGIGTMPAAVMVGFGVALIVAGVGMWFLSGGSARQHAEAAAEAALRGLEEWDADSGDRAEVIRGATLLVFNSVATRGAVNVLTFDPVEARKRLGAKVALVEAVERYLIERNAAYPVFTEAPRIPDGSGRSADEGEEDE